MTNCHGSYHHKAIVDEGLWYGDKYQSIALHENILFSYSILKVLWSIHFMGLTKRERIWIYLNAKLN
jgi:hypothetical protein